MPKQRTHSGAKKRFRRTRRGRVLHVKANHNHLLEGKTSRRKRRLRGVNELDGRDRSRVDRLIDRS